MSDDPRIVTECGELVLLMPDASTQTRKRELDEAAVLALAGWGLVLVGEPVAYSVMSRVRFEQAGGERTWRRLTELEWRRRCAAIWPLRRVGVPVEALLP